MKKLNLKNKISESRNNLIAAIENNPEHWDVDPKRYNDAFPVRLRFESRSDNSNPNQLVLFHPCNQGECKPHDVAALIESRFINDNQGITPRIVEIANNVSLGFSTLNEDIIIAVTDFARDLSILKAKVIDSHLIDTLSITDMLEKKGCLYSDISGMREDLISLSRSALIVNTDENGKCALNKAQHLVDNITCKQGQRKIIKEYPEKAEIIKSLNRALKIKDNDLEMSL